MFIGILLNGFKQIGVLALNSINCPSNSEQVFSKLLPTSITNTLPLRPSAVFIKSCIQTDLPVPEAPTIHILQLPLLSNGFQFISCPRLPPNNRPGVAVPFHSPCSGRRLADSVDNVVLSFL